MKTGLSVEDRINLRTIVDMTGWNAYTAFCICNRICEEKNTTYAEIIEKRLWTDYRLKEAESFADAKREDFSSEADEEDFYDDYYFPRQKKAREKIKKGQLTLKTLFNFLRMEIPEGMGEENEDVSEKIKLLPQYVEEGDIFICVRVKYILPELIREKKPRCIIGYPSFEKKFEGSGIPYIAKGSLRVLMLDLANIWRRQFSNICAGVSGSIGKSTTSEMMRQVSGIRYDTYIPDDNLNTVWDICQEVIRCGNTTEMYIQECSGSAQGVLERNSRIIEPDVFVLTNIGDAHLEKFSGNRTLLTYEKLALDRNAREGGTGIVNWDDEMLKKAVYRHDIVSFAINDPSADFFAADISEKNGRIQFDVIEKNGRSTAVTLNMVGIYNVYSALAAFAFGVIVGIDREDIAKQLEKYKTKGIRQNVVEYDGQTVFLDAYNATVRSIDGAVKALASMKVAEKSRHIAVLGDILEQGEMAEERHKELGRLLAEAKGIDVILFYGENMKLAYETVSSKIRCRHTLDINELIGWIKEEVSVGDAILFKGSHGMFLNRAVDEIYGTMWYFLDDINIYARSVQHDEIKYRCIDDYGAGIEGGCEKSRKLSIPDEIEGMPVRVIGQYAFSRNEEIRKINIPSTVKCVGEKAFSNCVNIRKSELSEGLKIISECAFEGCRKLKEIRIPESCTTIEARAFAECGRLKKVRLPADIRTIAYDAFDDNCEAGFYVKAGSYAEKWAKEKGYKIVNYI